MKLHFYFIEQPWNGTPYIRYESVEAEERPKTYILKERPNGIYVSRIAKEKIGTMLTEYRKKLILLEQDDEKAKEIFFEYCKTIIRKCENEISDSNNMLKIISDWRNDLSIK